jgi:hypothetical protein
MYLPYTSLAKQMCSRGVRLDGVEAVEQVMDEVGESFCPEMAACPFFVPPCVAPEPPRCEDGVCV